VEEIQNKKPTSSYYLLHAVLAELNIGMGRFPEALDSLAKAQELTTVKSEKLFLSRKVARCKSELSRLNLQPVAVAR